MFFPRFLDTGLRSFPVPLQFLLPWAPAALAVVQVRDLAVALVAALKHVPELFTEQGIRPMALCPSVVLRALPIAFQYAPQKPGLALRLERQSCLARRSCPVPLGQLPGQQARLRRALQVACTPVTVQRRSVAAPRMRLERSLHSPPRLTSCRTQERCFRISDFPRALLAVVLQLFMLLQAALLAGCSERRLEGQPLRRSQVALRSGHLKSLPVARLVPQILRRLVRWHLCPADLC